MAEHATAAASSPEPARHDLAERVVAAVAAWPGVSAEPGARRATALIYDGEQLGHVHHGSVHADLPLPEPWRTQALEAGTVRPWFGDWVSKPVASDPDAEEAVELFRAVYDERSR